MSLMRPDDFRTDPYGYVTNQIGHALAVGCLGLVYLVVLICWLLAGEFPPKWSIIGGAAVTYALVEILQGWRGADTIEDWVFVVIYGVTGPVMTFDEVLPGSTKFQGDLLVALPFVGLFFCHLAVGAWLRRRRADALQRQG